MGTWIDFKEIRQQLKFTDVLRHYGVAVKVRGERATGFCPLPRHSREPRADGKRHSASFSVHTGKNCFHCFSCNQKGNCLEFVCLMEGLDPSVPAQLREGAIRARDVFCLNGNGDAPPRAQASDVRRKPREQPSGGVHKNAGQGATCPAVVNAPLDFELRHLDPRHPYLKERGLTQETIAHFGLGYCSRGIMQGRIAIPLHDSAGRLIGYAGRIVDDNAIGRDCPKYLLPGARERDGVRHEFHKSLLLYNAHRITEPVDDLVVVEGFASVWTLWQSDIPDVVALMGSDASREQRKLFVRMVKADGRVWIFTDGDQPGRRGARRLLLKLAPHRLVRWVKVKEGRQPTSFSPPELAGLIAL